MPWVTAFLGAALFAAASGFATGASAGSPVAPMADGGERLLGEWWTKDREGRVRFAKHADGTFRGTTTCCNPQKDVHNPDPKLRSRSTVGLLIIWGLKYDGDGEYEGGSVYNPRDGKTYSLDAELLAADELEITGYLGISLLGQSQVWQRAAVRERKAAARKQK